MEFISCWKEKRLRRKKIFFVITFLFSFLLFTHYTHFFLEKFPMRWLTTDQYPKQKIQWDRLGKTRKFGNFKVWNRWRFREGIISSCRFEVIFFKSCKYWTFCLKNEYFLKNHNWVMWERAVQKTQIRIR